MIDPFLKLLRELGLTPKELQQFKQKQTEFRVTEKEILKINEKALGSKTGTKSYNWKQLHDQVKNKMPTNVDKTEWTREEIEEIYREQQEQIDDLEKNGLSSEIVFLIDQTRQHYEMYSKRSRSLNDCLQAIQHFIDGGTSIEDIINILNEFNDIYIRYFDEEKGQFPPHIETKYFINIISAGNILGFE